MASPLFVSRFGHGPPILCLHGIEAHGVRYVGLASHLRGSTLVAPDLRGHGRSTWEGSFDLEQHVADLMPLLEEAGPGATLLGHSYGGLIAWELARAAPDAVARLILVDPAINVDPAFAQESLRTADFTRRWPGRLQALQELMQARSSSAHWSIALDAAVGMADGPGGVVSAQVRPEAVEAAWSQMTRPLSTSAFRGPTLLVEAGRARGAYCTPPAVAVLEAQLGQFLEHVVIDAPHTITADAPDELAARVEAFMQSS